MSTVNSPVLSARPIEVTTTASLEDIRDTAWRFRYSPGAGTEGWGSYLDSTDYLDMQPNAAMQVRRADIIDSTDSLPRRLRLRYYWTQPDLRVRRPARGQDTRPLVLKACDVLIYETNTGRSVLCTTRNPQQFRTSLNALKALLYIVDERSRFSVDNTTWDLPNDFFLWLFERCENSAELGDSGLTLQGMSALSSLNSNKAARFRDGATQDRIELVSLIAVSAGQFGPAKFSVVADEPEATFDLDLHLDGGFQPRRTSDYEDTTYDFNSLGVALFDDLWIRVLPRLRAAYNADRQWDQTGRDELKRRCIHAVTTAIQRALDEMRDQTAEVTEQV